MSDEKDFDATPDASDEKENENTQPEKKGKPSGKGPFWTAMVILIILLLLSFVLLGIKLAEYAKIDEREVMLKSNMDAELDIFSVTYKNATGNIIIEGADGEKVIAPGAAVDYSVRLRNKDTIALDYTLIVQVDTINEDDIPGVEIPVVFRLLDPHGDYLAGDPKTWAHSLEMDGVSHNDTIKRGESYEYLFQWKWPFEGGSDELDTYLGDLAAAGNDIGLKVTFTLRSEVNTSLAANGGFWGSGLGTGILFILIVLLLLIAIILLIIHFYRKIKAEHEQLKAPDPDPDGTGTDGDDFDNLDDLDDPDNVDDEFKIPDDDTNDDFNLDMNGGSGTTGPVVPPVGQTGKADPKSDAADLSADIPEDASADIPEDAAADPSADTPDDSPADGTDSTDGADSESETDSGSQSQPQFTAGPIPVGVPVSGSSDSEDASEDASGDDSQDASEDAPADDSVDDSEDSSDSQDDSVEEDGYEDEEDDEEDYEDDEDDEDDSSKSKKSGSKSKSKSKSKHKRKHRVAPFFVPGAGSAHKADDLPEVDDLPETDDLPEDNDLPEVDTTPVGDTVPEGEAVPEGDAVPEGEATPEGDVAPEGEAAPEGDAVPEGEAAPEGEVASETENAPETEPVTESEPESAAPSDEQTQE